jgi:hypothetical protein
MSVVYDPPEPFEPPVVNPPSVPDTKPPREFGAILSDVVSATAGIATLYEEIATRCRERDLLLREVYLAIGDGMLARGQKTKRVHHDGRTFVVEVGYAPVLMCACHGALLGQCAAALDAADAGEVQVQTIIARAREPYLSVRELDAKTDAEAA